MTEVAKIKQPNDEKPWSHCPFCTSSKVEFRPDGNYEFECQDCAHRWDGSYNHYDHEPEVNSDR